MKPVPQHRSRLIASPWNGVYATALSSGREFHRHWHSTYGIGMMDAGAHRSASGRGQVDAFAGDLIATNPGEVHDGRPLAVEARSWRIVYIDPEMLAAQAGPAAKHLGPSLELTRPVFRDPGLRRVLSTLLSRLQRWMDSASGAERYACDEALAAVCGRLLERHSTSRPQDAFNGDLRQVRERLADEWQAAPDLAELAGMAGLSRYQLLRRFHQSYGVTPHAWLVQQRSERARHLIAGGAGLSAAAAQAGFADQSHMTRMFVRSFGFTPGQWRLAMTSGGSSKA